jgi:hypothetical protein
MHIFRLYVTAGPGHPTHFAGVQLDAICMVDSPHTDEARQKASDRLAELRWASATFRDTILLPPNPDISGFNQVMLDAFQDAKELGVSLIVYPEPSGAA